VPASISPILSDRSNFRQPLFVTAKNLDSLYSMEPGILGSHRGTAHRILTETNSMTRNDCCVGTILIAFIWGCLASAAYAQMGDPNTVQKGAPVATHANGTFEVKLEPLAADDKAEGTTLGRMSIDKHFHGGLEGTSKGEMLSAMTDVKGSAGYVAMERVTGTLKGRTGSFVLQHTATMTRGMPELSITVVPDSGSGQLVGLTGKMEIKINEGKHSYDFEYTLPAAP
jgi:hypothetical protein